MRRFALLIFAATLFVGYPFSPGRAQQDPLQSQQLVRVASISPWIDKTHPFRLTLQITNTTEVALQELTVRVTFFGRVGSRSELRASLDRGAGTGTLGSVGDPVPGSVAPGAQRTVTITRPASEIPGGARSGVYPIDITVRHSLGETTVHTALPRLAAELRAALNVTWIIPVVRPTVVARRGLYPPDVAEVLALEELTQQMESLAGRASSFTLAPSPLLMDTLADLADGFGRSTETNIVDAVSEEDPTAQQSRAALEATRTVASAAGELATAPYAPARLSALAARGLGADLLSQVSVGRAAIEQRLGRTPSLALLSAPGGDLDQASARSLAQVGLTGFVVSPASLVSLPSEPFRPDQFGVSRPVGIRARDVTVTGLLPDEPLKERLDAEEQGVLLAQALIAETASAFFELPLFAADRVLVISSERMPSPTALAATAAGLGSAPWVRLRTASESIAALPPQGEPSSLRRAEEPDRTHLVAARAARRQVAALKSLVVTEIPEVDVLDRLVLASESAEWDRAPSAGAALAREASERVAAVLRNVGVAQRHVTLTSRTGIVPVTLVNDNEFPIRVRVRFSSPKLAFPEGDSRTIELPTRINKEEIKVEARAAGSFPLDVLIETPDGRRVLARGQLILRSTAVSAVSLAVVGGSAALLLVSWVRRNVRHRRRAARG